jgi:hypothetical protein
MEGFRQVNGKNSEYYLVSTDEVTFSIIYEYDYLKNEILKY